MYYSSRCDIGDRKRQQNKKLSSEEQHINEDSTASLVFEDIHQQTEREVGLFVVADGAGGEDAGDVASYLATTVISEQLAEYVVKTLTNNPSEAGIELPAKFGRADDRVDPTTAIDEAVQAAQQRVIEYAKAAGEKNADPNNPFKAYTTVVAGIYDGERLHYGWVGDSRAYVINGATERISPLTRDHSEVQALEDTGAIDETEALVHPESHRIRRAVGGTSFSDPEEGVEVDTGTVAVYAEDVLLFTSDGLIDAYPDIDPLHRRYQAADGDEQAAVAETIEETVVTDEDIRELVLQYDSLDACSEQLVEFANDHGGKDNLSILLAQGENLPPTPDPLPSRGFEDRSDEDIASQETTIVHPAGSNADEESAPENGSESEADVSSKSGRAEDPTDDTHTERRRATKGDDTQSPDDREAWDQSTVDGESPHERTGSDDVPTSVGETPSAAEPDESNSTARQSGAGSTVSTEKNAQSANDNTTRVAVTEDSTGGQTGRGETQTNGAEMDGDERPSVRMISQSGESYTLSAGETFGRGKDADVQIDGPNMISRVHAQVVVTDDGECRLSDDSTGGTYIEADDGWRHVKDSRTPPLDSGTMVALGTRHETCVFEVRF